MLDIGLLQEMIWSCNETALKMRAVFLLIILFNAILPTTPPAFALTGQAAEVR